MVSNIRGINFCSASIILIGAHYIMLFLGLRALVEGDDGRVTLLHSGNQIFAQNLSCPVSLITMTFNNIPHAP